MLKKTAAYLSPRQLDRQRGGEWVRGKSMCRKIREESNAVIQIMLFCPSGVQKSSAEIERTMLCWCFQRASLVPGPDLEENILDIKKWILKPQEDLYNRNSSPVTFLWSLALQAHYDINKSRRWMCSKWHNHPKLITKHKMTSIFNIHVCYFERSPFGPN